MGVLEKMPLICSAASPLGGLARFLCPVADLDHYVDDYVAGLAAHRRRRRAILRAFEDFLTRPIEPRRAQAGGQRHPLVDPWTVHAGDYPSLWFSQDQEQTSKKNGLICVCVNGVTKGGWGSSRGRSTGDGAGSARSEENGSTRPRSTRLTRSS